MSRSRRVAPEGEQPASAPRENVPSSSLMPSEWLQRRAQAFAEATSREPGRPNDGVTYGSGKPPPDPPPEKPPAKRARRR